jgi:hypothetical protein
MDNATNQAKQIGHRATSISVWRLTPLARKALLVLHLIAAIGWIGVDIALLVLLVTVRTSNDAALVISGFNAIGLVVPAAVPPLSLGILVTGLILGLGTRWVFIKLLLSLVMTVLVFVSLVPAVRGMDVLSTTTLSADAVRASLGAIPTMLLFPPTVSLLMLSIATILSIFKPWQRTPWNREGAAEGMAEG